MDEGPVDVLFWHNGGRSYSLVGEVGRDMLLEMGRAVNGKWTAALPVETTPGAADTTSQAPTTGNQTGTTSTAPAGDGGTGTIDSTGADAGSISDGKIILAPDKAKQVAPQDDSTDT